jgi:hypothetical protein
MSLAPPQGSFAVAPPSPDRARMPPGALNLPILHARPGNTYAPSPVPLPAVQSLSSHTSSTNRHLGRQEASMRYSGHPNSLSRSAQAVVSTRHAATPNLNRHPPSADASSRHSQSSSTSGPRQTTQPSRHVAAPTHSRHNSASSHNTSSSPRPSSGPLVVDGARTSARRRTYRRHSRRSWDSSDDESDDDSSGSGSSESSESECVARGAGTTAGRDRHR